MPKATVIELYKEEWKPDKPYMENPCVVVTLTFWQAKHDGQYALIMEWDLRLPFDGKRSYGQKCMEHSWRGHSAANRQAIAKFDELKAEAEAWIAQYKAGHPQQVPDEIPF